MAGSVYSTERRVDLVADGVDVALRVGPIADESVVARYLGDFRHILVASPTLVGDTGRFQQLADVVALPCATWGSSTDPRPKWKLGGVRLSVTAMLTVNDYLHLRDRELAGQFVTEVPSFLAAEYLQNGRLVEVLASHPFPRTPLHLLARVSQKRPIAAVRDFSAAVCYAAVDNAGGFRVRIALGLDLSLQPFLMNMSNFCP